MNKRIRKKHLSPTDREAQRKGFALTKHLEHLAKTDEHFREWLQSGFDELANGDCVILCLKDLSK